MSENTYKKPKEDKVKVKKTVSFFKILENISKINIFSERKIATDYFPYLILLTAIGIFYVGNSHYADKTLRKTIQLEAEVSNLRADYTTLKADYMFASKQTEVAKKSKKIGLEETIKPPYKITIKKGEY